MHATAAWLIFVFLVEMRFHHVGQAGFELLTSNDPPTSASQSAGSTYPDLLIYGILVCTRLLLSLHEVSSPPLSPPFTLYSLFFETEFHSVAQVVVQWHDLDLLQPLPHGFK